MKNPLRRLLPCCETHLLMGRSGTLPLVGPPADVQMLPIKSIGDPAADALDAFAGANGFPEGWTREMLADGATAVIARDAAAAAVLAMGWMTQRPFHVEEIGATIDPGRGVYLFGDFVAPAQRGRRLQRQLVAARLRLIGPAAFACTLVHPTNAASVHNYEAQGFALGGRFVRYRWRGRTWARCRAIDRGPVTFELTDTDRILARGD